MTLPGTAGLQDSGHGAVMFLDLKALAQHSSCSVRWLRARLTDKVSPLPHYRVGGKVLVKPDEFDAWMTRYRVASPSSVGQMVDDVVSQFTRPGRAA